MRTSLDAFYHIKRVCSLPQGRGECGRTFMNTWSRKDREILVENSKKIVEGQRPILISHSGFAEKMNRFRLFPGNFIFTNLNSDSLFST